MSNAEQLAEVSTDALMREIKRRLDCQSKPDKRLILVGGVTPKWKFASSPPPPLSLPPPVHKREWDASPLALHSSWLHRVFFSFSLPLRLRRSPDSLGCFWIIFFTSRSAPNICLPVREFLLSQVNS
jgi:hypothetical protein